MVSGRYRNEVLQSQYNDALRDAIRNRTERGVDFSFEEDAQGWDLDADASAGVGAGTSAEVSSAQASDGVAALALDVNFTGGAQEAGVVILREGGIDWSAHTTLTLDVYAPEGANDFAAQVYTITGEGLIENGSQHVALIPGRWTRVSVQLNLLGDLSDVRALGIRIGTNFTAFDGTFYVDNLRFGDQPDVQFEFPAIEDKAIDVQGVKAGSYTVEIWDTQAGQVISTWDAETSDGTIHIPLPSFNTDLAIKVKPG